MTLQIVPESAPFSSEQRAWLNGFLAGMLGVQNHVSSNDESNALPVEETFPWHDSGLPIVDRMQMAEGRPIERRMMAAMAQLDCGTCGYLCKTYAEALANGSEKNLTLCSPGGSETAKMLRQLSKEKSAAPKISETKPSPSDSVVDKLAAVGTRNNPVVAKWIRSHRLNHADSAKDTRHVEINLSDTGLRYRVGDALGIWPSNCNALVATVIQAAKLDPHVSLDTEASAETLSSGLANRCLRNIPMDLVARSIECVRQRPKYNGSVAVDANLIEQLTAFGESDEIDSLDVVEFFERFPNIGLSALDLMDVLSPIQPRLYSIASSQSVKPDQVHLTIGRVEKNLRGRARKGVASTMLADRMESNPYLRVFVQRSHGFSIPADPNAPMIMVGPGTGIAPFIAFLQQREFDKAPGKNWLFFGDQRKAFDFLYQEQLEAWHSNNLLHRLDLAFSRDGDEKVYVQHRMREHGAELFAWLDRGGYFYVCGDASRMAVDVDRALLEIVAEHGRKTPEQAKAYLTELGQTKRYVRDVY